MKADYEMKQLLQSINRVNQAQFESIRHFESHIFFDGGVKGSKPSEFALQLLSLLPTTLLISPKSCRQLKTPYGLCLKWMLPAPGGKNQMKFCIHLKDNLKVKNKKRWSQIMYMSYVLDYLLKEQHVSEISEGFIVTTDADVFFTADSVEALLDLMNRDESVGAVCARTYPLGSGPLIWYQKFEYAIGHWLQKSAEDMLGSVLCSPGCFSVYRCDAIADVLPLYSSTVNEAFDFLIKDMGEDRWFCTLMLKCGWRIDYCAVADNSTHCPDNFEEFFKQRRRWIVSTIANLILVVKESRILMRYNRHVSVFFIIYQFVLLLSTVIAPATVILVVAGGLQYGWSISSSYSIVVQYLFSAAFIIICLSCPGDFQLKVAKIFTFFYAIIMTVVTIGTIVQVVEDLQRERDPDSTDLPLSISDIYLFSLIAMFVLTSLCHLKEITSLLNGVWYLLCLPTGYLVLIIYSICNLTDKSWGTREDTSASSGKESHFLKSFSSMLRRIFTCCRSEPESKPVGPQTPLLQKPLVDDTQSVSEMEAGAHLDGDHDSTDGQQFSVEYGLKVIPVQNWLPGDFKDLYAQYFINNGYDDTRLISGMQEKELVDIGIKSKGHRQFLMDMIKLLPDFEPDTEVPDSVSIWLQNIGLEMYQTNFTKNCITYRRDMAVLKSMSSHDIKRELKIIKMGHIKRLQLAIKKLLDPTEAEKTKMQIKRDLSLTQSVDLPNENPIEADFWKTLCQVCLDPSSAFSREDELKGKLGELRNNWTLIISVSNTIWLVLLATIAAQANLSVYQSNPLGFVFLAVFGFIFLLQFICMLFHRIGTLMHTIARSPYKFGSGFKTSWSFSDKRLRQRKPQAGTSFESDYTTGRRIRDFENSQRLLGNV
ncbi:chitin synthase chs-2-like [Argonauta hians]